MSKRLYRRLQGLLLLISILIIGYAFYLQNMGLQPCPLCMVQRFFAFLFVILCMVGLFLSTRRQGRILAVFQLLVTAAGLFFALRQLWLQSLPADQVHACLPGYDILIRYFPWRDILHAFFWGTSDCADITWQFLGFTLPAWAAFYFSVMFLVSAVLFFLLGRSSERLSHP